VPAAPLSASDILDREFLVVRAKLLEVAAALDRLDRAEGDVSGDPRRDRIRRAIRLIAEAPAGDSAGRAEQLQLLFSLPYRAAWREEFGIAAATP
jgi:hypothetical protein